MAVDRTASAAAVARIAAAFGGLAHPGDGKLLHPQCRDDMDIEAFYGGLDWRDVPAGTLARENASLCFMSAVGFQFYLPAYMHWALGNPDDPSASIEHVLYELDPGAPEDELHAFQVSKYRLLTLDQAGAIVAFLEVFRQVEGRGALAEAALAYWRGAP